jgi:hypothetical protein
MPGRSPPLRLDREVSLPVLRFKLPKTLGEAMPHCRCVADTQSSSLRSGCICTQRVFSDPHDLDFESLWLAVSMPKDTCEEQKKSQFAGILCASTLPRGPTSPSERLRRHAAYGGVGFCAPRLSSSWSSTSARSQACVRCLLRVVPLFRPQSRCSNSD